MSGFLKWKEAFENQIIGITSLYVYITTVFSKCNMEYCIILPVFFLIFRRIICVFTNWQLTFHTFHDRINLLGSPPFCGLWVGILSGFVKIYMPRPQKETRNWMNAFLTAFFRHVIIRIQHFRSLMTDG